MPFLKIDFASYNTEELLRKQLLDKGSLYLWSSLCLPINVASSVLLLRTECLPKKEKSTGIIIGTQIVALSLITVFYLAILAYSLFIREFLFTIVLCLILCDIGILIWWNFLVGPKAFFESILCTSGGAGLVKNFARIKTLNNWSFFLHLAVGLIGLLIYLVDELQLVAPTETPPSTRSILMFSTTLFSFAIASSGANCLFYTVTSVLAAEFHNHSVDFVEDVNNYQLAVAKHYVHTHWKLCGLFYGVCTPISIWTSFRVSVSFLGVCLLLSRVVTALSVSDPSLVLQSIDLLITLYLLISIATLIGSAVMFRKAAVSLRDSLIQVIASGRQLHDMTYTVAIAYIGHLRQHRLGFKFFGLSVIDRHFVSFAILLTLTATVYYISRLDIKL